jgi:nitrogen fixation/metabolism regulation signal transduction histidine kinase
MKSPNGIKAITFENKLLYLALLIGLVPTTCLLVALCFLTFSLAAKVLLLFLIVVGVFYGAFSIRHKVVFQLRTSTNLMESMSCRDHSVRARECTPDGALNEFNQMFNKLSLSLAQQRLVSKEHQILLNKVIAQIDVAIVAVDDKAGITLMNPNAEQLFRCRFEDVENYPISTLGLQSVISGEHRKVVEFEIEQYKKKVYIHTDEYFEQGVKHKLIFITDIQHILRDEEYLVWQKLLRVLSHEINNSLAPIASISETLSRLINQPIDSVYFEQEMKVDVQEGLAVITERSNSLNSFIKRYQELTRLPLPDKKLFDLARLISSTALLFRDNDITTDGQKLIVYGDEPQIQQVLVNLIKNAIQATKNDNKAVLTLTWGSDGNLIKIKLIDQGAGISNLDNIFVPFYTTKEEGSGIGLVLSRQIINNHGGDLTIANRTDAQGAEAIIYLPGK